MSDAASESGGEASPSINRAFSFQSNIVFFIVIGVIAYSCSRQKESNRKEEMGRKHEEAAALKRQQDSTSLKGLYPEFAERLFEFQRGMHSGNDKLVAEAKHKMESFIASQKPGRFRFQGTFTWAKAGRVQINWNKLIFLPEFKMVSTERLVLIAGEGVNDFANCSYSTNQFPSVWQNLRMGDPITLEATVHLGLKTTDRKNQFSKESPFRVLVTLTDITLATAQQ